MYNEPDEDGNEELAGWKQISRYLGITIPTARRYAKLKGLPVIKRGGRYFAVRSEVDRWRRTSTDNPPVVEAGARSRTNRLGSLGLLALVVFLVTILVSALLDQRENLIRVEVEGHTLVALGENDTTIWRVDLPDLTANHLNLPPIVRDVDGDGWNDVVLSVKRLDPERANGRLVCLSDTGEPRWSFAYGRKLDLHGRYFEPFYIGHHLYWVETWMGPLILVTARHATWFPLQLVLLDPATGTVVSEYWHPGYLEAIEIVDLDGDGQEELLIGGINNPGPGPGYPSLAVLDLPFAPSKNVANNYFGTANAHERTYLLFPRPDVFEPRELVSVTEIHVQSADRLQVAVASGRKVVHFYLDAELKVIDVRPSDSALQEHDRLFAMGMLDHPYSPKEKEAWRLLLQLPTAPDGNAAHVRLVLSQNHVQESF